MKKLLFISVIVYMVAMQFYGIPYVNIQNRRNEILLLQERQKETVEQRFENQDSIPYLKEKFLETDLGIVKCSRQLQIQVNEFKKLPFCDDFE